MKSSLPLTYIWLGFILAISFFEAPLKFQAPTVKMEQALDIGRLIFFWLNKIELLFLVLTIVFLFVFKEKNHLKTVVTTLGIALLIQSFWLLPSLDERAILRISGNELEPSNLHSIYIILELVKVALLIWVSSLQIKSLKLRGLNS